MHEGTGVRFLPGVGPSRAALLAKLGIETVGDLVRHFPRTHEDRTRIARIGESFEGIRDAAESVETSLQQQSSSTEEIAGFLEKVGSRCSENTRSAELASEASRGLRSLAQGLREHIARFRV